MTASTFQINSWKNWKQVSHRAIFFSAMIRDLWPTMTTHNVYFKMKWEIQWKKNRKCENIVVKWFHKYLYSQWLKIEERKKHAKQLYMVNLQFLHCRQIEILLTKIIALNSFILNFSNSPGSNPKCFRTNLNLCIPGAHKRVTHT